MEIKMCNHHLAFVTGVFRILITPHKPLLIQNFMEIIGRISQMFEINIGIVRLPQIEALDSDLELSLQPWNGMSVTLAHGQK